MFSEISRMKYYIACELGYLFIEKSLKGNIPK